MILQRILEHKRAELRHKRSRGYLVNLKSRIRERVAPLNFHQALVDGRREASPALIAEVKKASPSQGLMRPEFADRFDAVGIAETYRDHGASALSVLTDRDFFQGNLDTLASVKDAVGLPTLNKEFMVDECQFYEARAYGADAVLLIAAALERRQMQDFFEVARGLELEPLVETHDERELDGVLEWLPDVRLIGINNRDLRTFSTDLGVTLRLAKRIPPDKLVVSESGIHKREDVERLNDVGVQAILVGESLLRAPEAGAKIDELLGQSHSASEDGG